MKITEKDTCIVHNFSDLSDWNEFLSNNGPESICSSYNQNIVFSFEDGISFDPMLLDQLGKFSLALSEIKKSFVVVTSYAKEDVDHEINLVPTEHEAIEFIFMEEIERSF